MTVVQLTGIHQQNNGIYNNMATTVTTLNYLTSTKAGNTLRDNGSFSGITYVPAAAVAEAFTTFNADGTFSPQGGSAC